MTKQVYGALSPRQIIYSWISRYQKNAFRYRTMLARKCWTWCSLYPSRIYERQAKANGKYFWLDCRVGKHEKRSILSFTFFYWSVLKDVFNEFDFSSIPSLSPQKHPLFLSNSNKKKKLNKQFSGQFSLYFTSDASENRRHCRSRS